MFKKIVGFISKNLWKVLAGIVAAGILYLGYGFTRDLLFGKALEAARQQYQQQIADLQTKIELNKAAYMALAEKSAREREAYRTDHEREISNINTVFGIFKSTSAAELKKKGAKIEEVLAEKEKDEAALFEAKETIATLDMSNGRILANWELSDMVKDESHKEIVDDLETKFTKCQQWTSTLEKKLKPKPFAKVVQVAVVVSAFFLGRITKGV